MLAYATLCCAPQMLSFVKEEVVCYSKISTLLWSVILLVTFYIQGIHNKVVISWFLSCTEEGNNIEMSLYSCI
jgi:hypothetical protein